MLNAIRCTDQRLAFKNSGILCLALIFILSNLRMTILHSNRRLQIARLYSQYTVFFCILTPIHGLVVKLSCSESGCSGSILAGCWNSLPPLGHFAWHWASQCTDSGAFCIAALSIIFFFGFRQWWSCSDRVLTLNMNIRLPLFWSTSSRARVQDLARCAGLAHGRDYSDCRASEKMS